MMTRVMAIGAILLAALSCRTNFADEIEIGTKAPDFKATGVDGKEYSLASVKDADVVVVAFTCNDCPVAVAYEDRFIAFQEQFGKNKKVAFLAINANNATEGLDAMKQRAGEKGFKFPYAFDASGESAKSYGARVTPHMFILDKARNVAYRGAFDDKQTGPTKSYVVDAVNALLAGKTPETASTNAFGCGIKLK
jgi:peroxiredoxin